MEYYVCYVYSASEIPEYRLPWRAVRWEIDQMVEHGRGGVRLEYGRRLFSPTAAGSKPGDITLKVRTIMTLLIGYQLKKYKNIERYFTYLFSISQGHTGRAERRAGRVRGRWPTGTSTSGRSFPRR